MPSQNTSADKVLSVMQVLGPQAKAIHDQVKNRKVETKGGSLPAGIRNGIAQVVRVSIKETQTGRNKGKPIFILTGTAKEPIEHNGVRVFGKPVIVTENLFDTSSPNSQAKRQTREDHYWFMLETIASLLGMSSVANIRVEQVDSLFAKVNEKKPHFEFQTFSGEKQVTAEQNGQVFVMRGKVRQGGPFKTKEDALKQFPYADKEPMVNTMFLGGMPNYKPTVTNPLMKDTSEQVAVASSANGAIRQEESPATDMTGGEGFPGEFGDLESLAQRADAKPVTKEVKQARRELEQHALNAGVSQEEIDNADDWASVVTMIMESGSTNGVETETTEGTEDSGHGGQGSEEGIAETTSEEDTSESQEEGQEEEVEEAEWFPTVGKMCLYVPIDPTTRKPAKKPVECEVRKVNEDRQVADLFDVARKKVYTSCPFSRISKPS